MHIGIALLISVVLQLMTQLVASTLLYLLYSHPLHTSQFTNPQEPSAVVWPNAALWLGCTLQCSGTACCKVSPQAPSLLCWSGCGHMRLGHSHSLMPTDSDVWGQTQGPISRVILRVWYPGSDTQCRYPQLIPRVNTQCQYLGSIPRVWYSVSIPRKGEEEGETNLILSEVYDQEQSTA